MGDGTTLRSFRLTDEDIENIDRVVRSGDATNATDAVRLALHEYVSRAAERESIGHRLESLDDRTPPNPMGGYAVEQLLELLKTEDRKSTRLNSSHQIISYAVFCLKKKMKSTR